MGLSLSGLNLSGLNLDPAARAAVLAEAKRLLGERKLFSYAPYPKQQEFHAAGATHRERLFMAGNQLGKTLSGGFETAMHLTGLYPDDWPGRRWDRPVVGWASGITNESVRDTTQRILMGRPGQHGTGAIPKRALVDVTAARGIADGIDTVQVRHVSGGTSLLSFKSYERGREKWQGETLDFVWYDEEPSEEIYTEGLTRTNATGGMAFMTFTPLLGMSNVVRRFLSDPNPDRIVTRMTIDDALHYTAEQRAQIIASYPPHEREARAKGIPVLGSGRIFPIAEDRLQEPALNGCPAHWPRVVGLDFGWDHPTAACWLAWDRDTDTVHVYDCYRVKEETPVVHAAALRARGTWLPVAWPHDGLQHDKGSGEQLAEQYRAQGVNMCGERATFEDGSNGVEAGLALMLDRMKTGRLKVAAHLQDWWDEFRLYHRRDGKVVKEHDDLMSATRYALMMLRYACCEPRSDDDEEFRGRGRAGWMGA